MIFSLPILQRYLLRKHGILPEHVQWDTHLRQDLRLTDVDIQGLLNDIVSLSDLSISAETTRNLTDVFDLMVFVLLRSMEELAYSSDFGLTNLNKLASDFPQFSVLACRMNVHGAFRFDTKKDNN